MVLYSDQPAGTNVMPEQWWDDDSATTTEVDDGRDDDPSLSHLCSVVVKTAAKMLITHKLLDDYAVHRQNWF